MLTQVLKNQGPRYVAFRAWYELRRKRGWLKNDFPTAPEQHQFISLEAWKQKNIPFFFQSKLALTFQKTKHADLQERFDKIAQGEVLLFNASWKKLGKQYDWITNPDSGFRYDISQHWSLVEDISKEAGDIKFVWEKSRFSYLYDIIRHDYHYEQDHAELVFSEIENWIAANPINLGPNYKCSQEISLRCLNWTFALYYYRDSVGLTEARFQRIMHALYWQIRHVYSNINFSRICVRNNHAITETMMLYLGGMLFPFFPEAAQWKKDGKKWWEEEIAYQVYEDGTFLQFSHNYQRVLVQLLTWGITLSELHQETLTSTTISRASSVVSYLYNCCVGKNGELPNYGNNDGALFFKLNSQLYPDFRPQLNALAFSINKEYLFSDNWLTEDIHWMQSKVTDKKNGSIDKTVTIAKKYDQGGILTLSTSDNSFTFFKCTAYKDRPSQADNLHVDIWWRGKNYFRDAGIYKYNTTEQDINFFAGTLGHNTLILSNKNQMKKGPRFIWYNWTKNTASSIEENAEEYILTAWAEMFPELGANVKHTRTIRKNKLKPIWTIVDRIENLPTNVQVHQLWHPNPNLIPQVKITATDNNGQQLQLETKGGYFSDHYGEKEAAPTWSFTTVNPTIQTEIQLLP